MFYLAFTFVVTLLGLKSIFPPKRGNKTHAVLIGTFHNANWMHAHVLPIIQANDGDVILVCDEVVTEFDGLTYLCPPKWLSNLVSRALSKFLWSIYAVFKYRPYLVMGYHIFPAAIIALVAARLGRAYAGYQVTAGELELVGGGWNAENPIMRMLGRDSKIVEKSVLSSVRQFDLVVVRGSRAKAYISASGYRRSLATITGSVEAPTRILPFAERQYDVGFVGRLAEYKRPDRLLNALAMTKKGGKSLRSIIIGDGPDLESLRSLSRSLGLEEDIDWAGKRHDVVELIGQARIFVLTSRWEGVSIALLEAMACGCVPVVSDVGDLSDVVSTDNGFILEENNLEGFSEAIRALLDNPPFWTELSQKSVQISEQTGSITEVSFRWRTALKELPEKRSMNTGGSGNE